MNPKTWTHCAKCRSRNLRLPEDRNDESPVMCVDCGQSAGTFAELKVRLAEQAFSPERRAREALKRMSLSKRH